MKYTILTILLCISTAVSAETVVITGAPYTINDGVSESEQSDRDAMAVIEKAGAAARALGWDVVQTEVACAEVACLEARRSEYSADLALSIEVAQVTEQYDISLRSTEGDPLHAELIGTFDEAMSRINEMVQDVLERANSTKLSSVGEEDVSPPLSETKEATRGLHPAAFWTVFGTTLALGAGAGIVEGIGYKKLNDFEDKTPSERTTEEKRTLERLRTTEIVLVSAAATGAVTALILGLLTDFKKDESMGALQLSPQKGGVSVQLSGSF